MMNLLMQLRKVGPLQSLTVSNQPLAWILGMAGELTSPVTAVLPQVCNHPYLFNIDAEPNFDGVTTGEDIVEASGKMQVHHVIQGGREPHAAAWPHAWSWQCCCVSERV
jgi:hypothetical protein